MEMLAALAVLAFVSGLVIASYNTGLVELRRASGQLAGTIRATYDAAALTGQTHRLAFVVGEPEHASSEEDGETQAVPSNVVRVEATEQVLSFDENSNPLVRSISRGGAGASLDLSSLFFGELSDLDDIEPPSALNDLFGDPDDDEKSELQARAGFTPTENTVKLSPAHLASVWVRGMNEPADQGEVYLYFFPHGATQEALIHLEDDDGNVFTVEVASLTGKTRIHTEYKEIPK